MQEEIAVSPRTLIEGRSGERSPNQSLVEETPLNKRSLKELVHSQRNYVPEEEEERTTPKEEQVFEIANSAFEKIAVGLKGLRETLRGVFADKIVDARIAKQHVELLPAREFKDTLRIRVEGVDD